MPVEERVEQIHLEDEMKSAYLDYAMSVIVGRALPDVRDGLKPVHRRILYAMFREGLLSSRRYSKCAGVVGEVIKKYHPHGDAAVYDALVRMAQNFNMRYLLVDGQGNFGSVDGDPPAAYRYTEARLTRLAEELLADIDMETVNFSPNFDEVTEEPVVLPTRIPNLLINGSSGIAVGMATNIPPNNLGEIIDGLIMMIDTPDVSLENLMEKIKGPDFPTAGAIHGTQGILDAYKTGRGIIQMRARAFIESNPKNDRESIIVTELPYQVNKARLIERMAELVRDKKVEGISDLRDESDRDGMRIVLELKKGEIATIILNQLFKLTQLQSTFGVIMLALVNNQPKVLSLREMLFHFIEHRREVVVRRTQFELRKAEERAHILEGLKVALDHLDEVITLIRQSQSPEEARVGLITRFGLTAIQAQAILDMRLQRLTGLERQKLVDEYQQTLERIGYLQSVLGNEALVLKIIKDELTEVRERYSDPRKTEILPETEEISLEDLITPEEAVITVSHTGYIKRNPVSIYRSQRRGGKGKIAMGVKEQDFVEHLFIASTRDYLLFFTEIGRVYWLKVHQIPEAGRMAKGKAIVNLLQLSPGDGVSAILPVSEFREDCFVVMGTRQGVIKKTSLEAYSNPRNGGIIAISLDEGDRLVGARIIQGNQDILMGTRKGLAIRFHESDVRSIGRSGRGVRGITLGKGDEVVGMETISEDATSSILTVTERGFGKRTELEEYRVQGRGGKGIITIKTTSRNGNVVSLFQVNQEDEIMLMTSEGMILRLQMEGLRVIGRNTQGVKLIGIAETDRVVGTAMLAEKVEEEGSSEEPGGVE
ncbi:MAG TPA: DNA gyrase subunit A [Nitrospiria bacterium]